uniref:Sperm-associated antigen 1 n=1 Tax=Jaculus jaculus TaxID=51337 RepID=A0A8C5KJA2_JACJA
MTAKDYPSLWGCGTTKTFKIPIEHLDFKYIENCSNVKHLEKILCVLRSGEEGYYPELTEFCEKRLTDLAPKSRALRKDRPAATASSFTAEEWEKIDSDIKSWISEITREENTMHFDHTRTCSGAGDHLPPIRGSNSCFHVGKVWTHSKSKDSYIFIYYLFLFFHLRFDVEKECSKVDEDSKEKIIVDNKAYLSKIETRIDTTVFRFHYTLGLPVVNKYFFHRSISALPTVSAYNNRAQAEIKLEKWSSAFQDCEKVLELEPGNIKALLRRATTYKHQSKLQEAIEDLSKVLEAEPDNELAKVSTEESDFLLLGAVVVTHTSNSQHLGGRLAEGSGKKGRKRKRREKRSESADDLSILYSNRAACYLKDGNCSGCIQDCNRALELHPFSMKPLLRRATAYEALEQYRKAYVDYKTVLQIDCGVQLANDSINRITKILMELDGPTWREKLSPIPVVPTSKPLGTWCPAAERTADQETDSGSGRLPSITDEKMFQILKEAGNQYVKDKNYEDAVGKYSECLKINNKECAIYTNRALCYLKLCQFEEAKQDCDQALQIDGGNVKACYRRALAHKGLKNYQQSLSDLNKVLLLDPNIVEAKMELDEVTSFLKNDNTASLGKGKRKKIEIQEVSEGNEEELERTSEVSANCQASGNGDESSGLTEHSEKLQISKPSNAYEFGQVINAVSTRKDEEACAHLLAITEPKDLPILLSNKLEGDTLLLLIQSLKNYLVDKDCSLVYEHLLYLSKAERFKMMLTLLNKDQKEQIGQLFDVLSDTQTNHFTLEDIEALRRQYEL